MIKHFLELADYSSAELRELLDMAAAQKKLYKEGGRDLCLSGKTMVMLFEKPSSRTRVSFEVGMTQLGGSAVYLRPEDIGGLGQREPISDLTRVLNGYVDLIVARTFEHSSVIELAHYAKMPVINALTEKCHPCQAMADMLTIREHFGRLEGLKLAFIGDGNNMAYSLAAACMRLGLAFSIAAPAAYALPKESVEFLKKLGDGSNLITTQSPAEAAQDADIVYTDTWTSMGQEEEKHQRMANFKGYQINDELLKVAAAGAKVMHCLPAYRGLEITNEVMEGPQSIVFDQAENRLHFQRFLMKYLLEEGTEEGMRHEA